MHDDTKGFCISKAGFQGVAANDQEFGKRDVSGLVSSPGDGEELVGFGEDLVLQNLGGFEGGLEGEFQAVLIVADLVLDAFEPRLSRAKFVFGLAHALLAIEQWNGDADADV